MEIPCINKVILSYTWRDHRRYGYITNRAFFTDVNIINKILHAPLWICILFPRVQLDRYLTSERSERVRYRVEHSKMKFISMRGHVISSIYFRVCFVWLRHLLDPGSGFIRLLERVRYRVEHSKMKFISMRGHVISSIYFRVCFVWLRHLLDPGSGFIRLLVRMSWRIAMSIFQLPASPRATPSMRAEQWNHGY